MDLGWKMTAYDILIDWSRMKDDSSWIDELIDLGWKTTAHGVMINLGWKTTAH